MNRWLAAGAVIAGLTVGLVAGRTGNRPAAEDLHAAAAARDQRTVSGWKAYLTQHPQGFHAPEATAWLKALHLQVRETPRSPILRAEIRRLEAELQTRQQSQLIVPPAEPAQSNSPVVPRTLPTLGNNPTRAEVDAYLVALQVAWKDIKRGQRGDPNGALLRAVPTDHLEVLLNAVTTSQCWYFSSLTREVLPGMIGDEQRDLTIAWLVRVPVLIKAIVAHHWEVAAQAELRRGLTTNIRSMDQIAAWVGALGSLGDPADYPLLTNVLMSQKYGYWRRDSARELAKIPGFPIQEAIDRCWEDTPGLNGAEAFYPIAAEYGIRPALAKIVACVATPAPWLRSEVATTWLREHTDAPEETERLGEWLGKPDEPPRFDPANHRWIRGPLPEANQVNPF